MSSGSQDETGLADQGSRGGLARAGLRAADVRGLTSLRTELRRVRARDSVVQSACGGERG